MARRAEEREAAYVWQQQQQQSLSLSQSCLRIDRILFLSLSLSSPSLLAERVPDTPRELQSDEMGIQPPLSLHTHTDREGPAKEKRKNYI